jgi:hypothetical protein
MIQCKKCKKEITQEEMVVIDKGNVRIRLCQECNEDLQEEKK